MQIIPKRFVGLIAPVGAIAAVVSLVTVAGAFGGSSQAPPAGGGPPAQAGPPPGDPFGPDLFIAIRKGDIEDAKAALAKGAQTEAPNWLGITPLMWAAAMGNKNACVALIEAKADVNAPSPYGTALSFAEMGGNKEVVRLLLDKGARPTKDRVDGITPLMTAAETGRTEVLRLLLDHKHEVNARDVEGTTALMFAARRGRTQAARVLLDAGADLNAADVHGRTALMYAALNDYPTTTELLLSRRPATVNARDKAGNTALSLAARYGTGSGGDGATFRALLKAGADKNVRDARGRTAWDIAVLRAASGAADALRPTGTRLAAADNASRDLPRRARAAAQGSLALIEHSGQQFSKQAPCLSCHHQGLGLMVSGLAKERGFTYSKLVASTQISQIRKEDEAHGKEILGVLPRPELYKHVPTVDMGEFTPGLTFLYSGLLAHGERPGPVQSASTAILASQQYPDGQWGFVFHRAPMQSSPFATTAMAVRLMKAYMPQDRSSEAVARIARAKAWLIAAPVLNNDDRVFRLLGLKWAGADAKQIKKATDALRAAQRPDGGWAQLSGPRRGDSGAEGDEAYFRSDAYATGQALYALHLGGGVPTSAEAYRRGVEYLLRTRDDDGSWLVTKRAIPANTFMDAGFPHGESQYISYSATCWATMALMLAAKPDDVKRLSAVRKLGQ
jgi:ankyrin repeat protein